MAVEQSSTILIEELSGDKRSISLVGAALPFQGAAWGSQMRLKTQWYVGNNAEATQQVLGPIELPSEWEGEWNTTRMIVMPSHFSESDGSQRAITRASTMREIVDTVFQSGQRLRVTWSTGSTDDARRIVREGRAAEWNFRHARMDDIAWTIRFEWIGRGRVMQKSIALRGEDMEAGMRDAQGKLADAVAKAINDQAVSSSKKRSEKSSASAFSLGDLEAFANGPMKMLQSFTRAGDAVVNRMKHIGALATKMRGMTKELASELVDTATNAVAVSNQFLDEMSNTAPETTSLSNKVSNLLQATSYYGATEENVESVADASITMRDRARQRQAAGADGPGRTKSQANSGDILGVWVVRQGDTYASISIKFYGTADHSYAIAKANARSTKQGGSAILPPPGVVLIIPNLDAVKDLER